jgi:hypothetical protein
MPIEFLVEIVHPQDGGVLVDGYVSHGRVSLGTVFRWVKRRINLAEGTAVLLAEDQPQRSVQLEVVRILYFGHELSELSYVCGRLHLQGIGGQNIQQGDALLEEVDGIRENSNRLCLK